MAVMARSTLMQSVRFQQLPDRDPSYGLPLGAKGDEVVSVQLAGSVALASRVEMMMLLPLVNRQPDVKSAGARGGTGIGDLVLGTRLLPWVSPRRDASFAVGSTLSFPSGGVRPTATGTVAAGLVGGATKAPEVPGARSAHHFDPDASAPEAEESSPAIGSGAFVPRLYGSYLRFLGPVAFQAEVGMSWTFRQDANVVVDYGLTVGWTPRWWWGLFAHGEARTFLRSNDSGLESLQAQPRELGDTSVAVSPGIWVAPSRAWSIAVSPQVPLTSTRDYSWGFSGTMAWLLD